MKRYIGVVLIVAGVWLLRFDVQSVPSGAHTPAERRLYNQLRKQAAAVVLFYHQERRAPRDPKTKELKQVRHLFGELASSGYYPCKAIRFMQLNTADPAVCMVAQDMHIDVHDAPKVVLFSNGVPIKDQHGLVALSDLSSRQTLKAFVDDYLTIDIAQHVQEERAFKRYQGVLRDRMHVYYTPYFSKVANPWNGYWGWPYYGMSQGHYGGNAGISFFGANY